MELILKVLLVALVVALAAILVSYFLPKIRSKSKGSKKSVLDVKVKRTETEVVLFLRKGDIRRKVTFADGKVTDKSGVEITSIAQLQVSFVITNDGKLLVVDKADRNMFFIKEDKLVSYFDETVDPDEDLDYEWE